MIEALKRAALLQAILGTMAAAAAEPIPVRIAAPGVATTIRRSTVDAGGRDFFLVRGAAAGQTLLVELNTANPEDRDYQDRIEVFPATEDGPNSRDLSLRMADWDHWLGVLPRAGAWRIDVVRPSKKPYVMRVTLLDPHDPRLDPGIAPVQIHMDLSVAGMKPEFELERFSPFIDKELIESWPAHLAYHGSGDMIVRVMPLEGFRRTFWAHPKGARESLALFEKAMKPGALESLPLQSLPGGVNDTADITFSACRKALEGPRLRAVRWLAYYSQDESAPFAPLSYCADAISKDGRFLVTVRMRVVSHPAVPNAEQNLTGAALRAFRKRLAVRLNAARPESFRPSMDALDAVVTGMRLH